MTTLRERAKRILGYIETKSYRSSCEFLDFVEHHLREACEEAVREDRARIIAANIPEIGKANTYIKVLESRPTAEDALKAVMKLTSLIKPHLPEGERGDALWCEYQQMFNGCSDLLGGHRDTPAAKAIIGEEKP